MNFDAIKEVKMRHGISRLIERFGISLTDEEYADVVEKILDYVVKPIFVHDHDGKSFHIFTIDKVKCILLFDWEYEVILTAYRMAWWDKNSSGEWFRTKRKVKSKTIRTMNQQYNFLKKHNLI